MFADAWNNHSLSSVRNLTPIQLWISGLAQTQDVQLTNVSLPLNNHVQYITVGY